MRQRVRHTERPRAERERERERERMVKACVRVVALRVYCHVHNCSKLLRASYYPNTTIVCAFTTVCTYRDSMRCK